MMKFCFILSAVALLSTYAFAQDTLSLPKPYETKSVKNHPDVIGWKDGQKPTVADGFTVNVFASGFDNPRWIYQAPNGDLFISEAATRGKSADRITIMQDPDNDGVYNVREVFLSDLNKPFGMLVLGNFFYVANTDGLIRYPYAAGQTKMTAKGEKIVDLPAGGYNNHWTRNIIASPDGKKIYISVGSGSNVAEHGMDNEVRRANILEINPDGTGEKIYASGLRNPVGMQFYPGTNVLWTAVNERDELGDNLVPDYITSVKRDGFYGWPYSYWGSNEDPRLKGEHPELVKKAIVPDVPLGAHTASLGMAFYTGKNFPQHYQNGVFVGQHGSWNRSRFSGYKVIFIAFKDGKPSGKSEDFLTGFVADGEKSKVYGRPVGVVVLQNGNLLVADDASNTLWQIKAVQ